MNDYQLESLLTVLFFVGWFIWHKTRRVTSDMGSDMASPNSDVTPSNQLKDND